MSDALSAERSGRFVDLHSHSTASDGTATPSAGVAAAHQAGVVALALTDHDTVAGVPEAQRAADALGMRLIPGVELSVHHQDRELHLLGLHLSELESLERALVRLRGLRSERAEAIVERLQSAGVPISFADVLAVAEGAAIGRPHVAKALVAGGWVKDHRDAFDRYLGAGRVAYVDKARLDVVEGIRLIHEAGGLAVFAHPAGEGRREKVESLVAAGLDGLEVRHPSHSSEDTKRLMALADFFKLLPSGGSDWHGATQGARVLGSMEVPWEWLERQDARVAARRTGVTVA